jgi:hypothetical protein
MSEIKNKYICEQCKFQTNIKTKWEAHEKTEKHKTGKRKVRSDYEGPHKCDKCNFESENNTNYKQHILNEHSNKEDRERGFKHYCKHCDFGTFAKILFEKHKNSERHKKHERNYS